MTTASRRTNKAAAKDEVTPEVSENIVPEEIVSDEKVSESTPETVSDETVSTETVDENPANRIPEIFAQNPMFTSLVTQYLSVYDEIASYNKTVIAEKSDSEWTTGKLLAEARKLASPDEGEPNKEIKDVYDIFERISTELAKARKAVVDATAKFKGISLSSVAAERDPAKEEELKEKRVPAIDIGKNMAMMAGLLNDEAASTAIKDFLNKYQLPAVGRDQTRNFAQSGGSTPKYRVRVEVIKDGNVLLTEDGFAKTGLALTQPVFGYERGKALKADKLREAWEAKGNTGEKTVEPVVEFEDNGLTFRITDKKSLPNA